MKTFEIVNIVENNDCVGTFDISIRNCETNEIVVADMCRIWDNDEISLRDMFEMIKAGEY